MQLETTDVAEKFPERVAEMYKKLEAYETTAFNPHRGPTDPAVRKTASFLEFSLCLSRACLGKMMHFIYNWRKNAVFRRRVPRRWVSMVGSGAGGSSERSMRAREKKTTTILDY